jgi:biotin carboxylase
MKTIVFIETNFSGLDAITYCKEKGYRSVLVTDSRERFKKWFPACCLYKVDLVDQIISFNDSNDQEEVMAALKKLDFIDAVLTFAEIRTRVTALICQALKLPGSDVEAIEIAQDKYRFRQVMKTQGVDNVQHKLLNNPQQLDDIKNQLNYPVFLKPTQGHSSIGATVCHELADIDSVIKRLSVISEDWISESYVVEDYLDGSLISIEILTTGKGVHQIIGISDRDVVHDSIEIGASFPLLDFHRQKIEQKACAALDAIGYTFGPSHVEIIVTSNEVHLVEINTRVGGSGHSIMLELSTGRSITGDYIELCLGQLDINTPLYEHQQGAAWHCFVSEKTGSVQSLPKVDEVKQLTGVKEVWLHHKEGDEISSLNSNYSWIIQVMCSGSDQREAKKNAKKAIDYIAVNAVIA